MYTRAIDYYVGRKVISGEDYLLQDDSGGVGVYFRFWNIEDKEQPSISVLDNIIENISFAIQFEETRRKITEAQMDKQREQMLLANKFVLDCSDYTVNLIRQAREAMEGSGVDGTRLVDYQGNPNDITLEDIDLILGDKEKGIVGEIPVRRLALHEQEIRLLEKVLLGQPYEIVFV